MNGRVRNASGWIAALVLCALLAMGIDDPFPGDSLWGPATSFDVFTDVDSDTVDLTRMGKAMRCVSGGTIKVTTSGGKTGTLTLASGELLPLRVSRIWTTSLTATGEVLY